MQHPVAMTFNPTRYPTYDDTVPLVNNDTVAAVPDSYIERHSPEELRDGYYAGTIIYEGFQDTASLAAGNHCVCGQPIRYVYTLRDTESDQIYEIGNICITDIIPREDLEEIKKENDRMTERRCLSCGQLHTGRLYDGLFCKNCRGGIRKLENSIAQDSEIYDRVNNNKYRYTMPTAGHFAEIYNTGIHEIEQGPSSFTHGLIRPDTPRNKAFPIMHMLTLAKDADQYQQVKLQVYLRKYIKK